MSGTQGNPPTVLAESRGYLEYYGQLREAGLPDQDLFDAMVTRYLDWVSRQQFLILGLRAFVCLRWRAGASDHVA